MNFNEFINLLVMFSHELFSNSATVPFFQFSIPQLEKGEDQVKELVLQEADDKTVVER